MKEFVNIKIRGEHIRNEETEKVNVNVSGNYYLDDTVHRVSYVETVDGFDDVVINTYVISDERLEIIREGMMNSRMIFSKKNPISHMIYKTPYGELSMEVRTNILLVDVGKNEINTEIGYSLFVDGIHTSDARMHIHISAIPETRWVKRDRLV